MPLKPAALAELKSNNYLLNALCMLAAKERGGTYGIGAATIAGVLEFGVASPHRGRAVNRRRRRGQRAGVVRPQRGDRGRPLCPADTAFPPRAARDDGAARGGVARVGEMNSLTMRRSTTGASRDGARFGAPCAARRAGGSRAGVWVVSVASGHGLSAPASLHPRLCNRLVRLRLLSAYSQLAFTARLLTARLLTARSFTARWFSSQLAGSQLAIHMQGPLTVADLLAAREVRGEAAEMWS